MTSTTRIATFLQDIRLLDQHRFELVQSLQNMILNLTPNIQAEMKYGGILFSTSNAFCGIFSYTKHVSLEFGRGASLSDPFNVLEGQGKFRRHIKLYDIKDISEKHVHEYLILALAQNDTPSQ